MEEASCERGVFVSDYLNNSDEFSIIQGPAARVRPSRLPENFFSCESAAHHCSVCVCICDHKFLFSSVNYEGLVDDLSVCQLSQNGNFSLINTPSIPESRLLCVCSEVQDR